VDPISAFALVTGAIQGVKTLCATVREAQAAGKEVVNLLGETTNFISQVLEGTDKLQKAEQEIRVNPPKNKSLQVLAFEEEMRKIELKQHYAPSVSSSWESLTPASRPIKPPTMVEKAGAKMGKMSLLSITLLGMKSPDNKAPTMDNRMIHSVMLTSSVTQNVSLAFTVTPLNHFLHLALNVLVGPPR